jgi:hypothetical protein
VQCRFKNVALTRVLAIEELQQLPKRVRERNQECKEQMTYLQDEMRVDVALGNVRVEVGAFDEAEEKFVNYVQVRPRELEYGLVLFWIKGVA